MNWSGVRAEEKIFHNVAVLREIVFYLDLEDILCLLESKVGRFEEVVIGKKIQEELLLYLVNSLAKEGWGNQMPLYGSEAFGSSQRKISTYVKILCFLGCSREKGLKDLYVKLLQAFPVARRSGVKNFNSEDKDKQSSKCSGENRGSIRTILGGSFTCMSTPTFVIAKLAENAMGAILDGTLEDGDNENLGDRSRYVGGGCLSESLVEGILSHLEDGDISFRGLDLNGIHLDSPASIIKFGTLMNKLKKSGNIGIGDEEGHIEHLRVSSSLCRSDWAELLRILKTNSHLGFDHLETTANNLKQAGGLVRQLWNQSSRSILILPEDSSEIDDVRCFYKMQSNFLNEWNFAKLVEFLVLGKC